MFCSFGFLDESGVGVTQRIQTTILNHGKHNLFYDVIVSLVLFIFVYCFVMVLLCVLQFVGFHSRSPSVE